MNIKKIIICARLDMITIILVGIMHYKGASIYNVKLRPALSLSSCMSWSQGPVSHTYSI